MKKTALSLLMLFLFVGLFPDISFCDKPPIKIGVILPLTGDKAVFGMVQKNSFVMGADEINHSGGINGSPIQLLFEDDKGKPDVGRTVTEKLITQDQVIALTGGYSSTATYAECEWAEKLKTPFLVTTSSADEITEQGWNYIFRLNPPSSEYNNALKSFLSEVVKPASVAIIYENTLFGASGAKQFAGQCDKAGIKVLVREPYDTGDLDFGPIIAKAKLAKVDMVYMLSYAQDAAMLMRQAQEHDFNAKLFVGCAAGFNIPQFATQAGPAVEFVFTIELWSPNLLFPGAKEYFENYAERFDSPTAYHGAQAYASLFVLANALSRTTKIDPEELREALGATEMMTAFGPVKFNSYGKKKQQNVLPTYLAQWQNGVLELVWPKNVATKPYVFPIPEWSQR